MSEGDQYNKKCVGKINKKCIPENYLAMKVDKPCNYEISIFQVFLLQNTGRTSG